MRCRGTLYGEAVPAAAVTDDAGAELADVALRAGRVPDREHAPRTSDLIRWVADHVESNGGRATVLGGSRGRANLLASFGPQVAGGLMLSGHTDVVPAGYRMGHRSLRGEQGRRLVARPRHRRHEGLHRRNDAHDRTVSGCRTDASTARRAVVRRGDRLHRRAPGVGGHRRTRRRAARRGGDRRTDHDAAAPQPHGQARLRDRVHRRRRRIPACRTASRARSQPPAVCSPCSTTCRHEYRPTGDPEVTFNCGTIHGGTALNVIAERCTFTFETRHTVDHDPDVAAATVLARGRRASEPRWPSTADRSTSQRSPATRRCVPRPMIHGCSVVERIADAGPATSIGYGTEGGLFAEALDASVVICGPGDIARRPSPRRVRHGRPVAALRAVPLRSRRTDLCRLPPAEG